MFTDFFFFLVVNVKLSTNCHGFAFARRNILRENYHRLDLSFVTAYLSFVLT